MNRYFSKLAKRSGIYAGKSSQRAAVDVNESSQQRMAEPTIEETVVVDQTLPGNATVKGDDVRHEARSTEKNISSLENLKPKLVFHEQTDFIADQDSLTDTTVSPSSYDPSEPKKLHDDISEPVDTNQIEVKNIHNPLTSTTHASASVEEKIASAQEDDNASVLNFPETDIHEQKRITNSHNKNRHVVKELNEFFSSEKNEPLELIDNKINKEQLDELTVSSSATVERNRPINKLPTSMPYSESVNESSITASQNSRAKTQRISTPKININIGKITVDIKQSNTKTEPPTQDSKAPLAESSLSSNRSLRLQRYYLRSL